LIFDPAKALTIFKRPPQLPHRQGISIKKPPGTFDAITLKRRHWHVAFQAIGAKVNSGRKMVQGIHLVHRSAIQKFNCRRDGWGI
jgi:hypothetical protein